MKDKRFAWNIILIIAMLGVVIFNKTQEGCKTVAVLTIILSCINAYRVRHDWRLFIIYAFIAYSNYSICMADYIDMFNEPLAKLTEDVYAISLNILYAFNTGLGIIIPKKEETKYSKRLKRPKPKPILESAKQNNFVFALYTILLIYIFFTGLSAPEEGAQRGEISAIYEYSVTIFIVAFFFSKGKLQRGILSGLLIAYILKDLLYGGRATSLQLILLFALVFVQHRLTIKQCLPIMLLGLVVLTAVGSLRGGFTFSGEALLGAFESIIDSRLALDTAYSAYYTSATFIKTASITTTPVRLGMFLSLMLSMILGGSMVPDANLAQYTFDFFPHAFGGMLPYHFYFYFGWFGIILVLFYIRFLFKKVYFEPPKEPKTNLNKCLGVYIAITVPRWYLYAPGSLIRGLVILIFIYACAHIMHKLTSE